MKPGARIRILVLVGLTVVVAHCVAILLATLRVAQLTSAHLRSAGTGNETATFVGAAVALGLIWLSLAALGVAGSAFGFACRFPGSGRLVPVRGRPPQADEAHFAPDPELGAPAATPI